MSWEHCDKTIPDDECCPVCQISKAQWTVEWNVTRTFAIGASKKPTLKFILHDADDEPLPGEEYEVELPDGSVVKGKLDAHGSAKVLTKTQGTCRVTFPGIDPKVWEKKASGAGSSE